MDGSRWEGSLFGKRPAGFRRDGASSGEPPPPEDLSTEAIVNQCFDTGERSPNTLSTAGPRVGKPLFPLGHRDLADVASDFQRQAPSRPHLRQRMV